MTTIEVADAKQRLEELVAKAAAGEEFVLVHEGKPLARLKEARGEGSQGNRRGQATPRKPGLHLGNIIHMAEDFDAPLGKEVWGEDL